MLTHLIWISQFALQWQQNNFTSTMRKIFTHTHTLYFCIIQTFIDVILQYVVLQHQKQKVYFIVFMIIIITKIIEKCRFIVFAIVEKSVNRWSSPITIMNASAMFDHHKMTPISKLMTICI